MLRTTTWSRRRRAALVLGCLGLNACSSGSSAGGEDQLPPQASPSPIFEDGASSTAFHPDASCLVTIDDPPLLPTAHVAPGTAIEWNSNPPSSGPHYPIWAAYQEYTSPVPRGYWLHSTEHGGIVLLYNCPQEGGCPDIVSGLRAAMDAMPTDPNPNCKVDASQVRVKVVLTPDPLIPTPVAAVAWGWTYTAACVDPPTLRAFMRDHYAKTAESSNCGQGLAVF